MVVNFSISIYFSSVFVFGTLFFFSRLDCRRRRHVAIMRFPALYILSEPFSLGRTDAKQFDFSVGGQRKSAVRAAIDMHQQFPPLPLRLSRS